MVVISVNARQVNSKIIIHIALNSSLSSVQSAISEQENEIMGKIIFFKFFLFTEVYDYLFLYQDIKRDPKSPTARVTICHQKR